MATLGAGIIAHIPTFAKLKILNIQVNLVTGAAESFLSAAFGLGPDPNCVGSLRGLIDLSFGLSRFHAGERLPLVKAIVRTCPLLACLTIPRDPELARVPPEYATEYKEAFSVISTLRNLEELRIDWHVIFDDWGPLRAAPKLRRLRFIYSPYGSSVSFWSPVFQNIEEKELGFVEIWCDSKLLPASGPTLTSLLDLHHKGNLTLSTPYYRDLVEKAIPGGCVQVLQHPLLLKASEAVPDSGETSLNILWLAAHGSFDREFFKLLAGYELRFQEVLKSHGRVGSMEFVDSAFQTCVAENSREWHYALLEEFPNVVSEATRFRLYQEYGRHWEPEVLNITADILAAQPEGRDGRLRALFNLSQGSHADMKSMTNLIKKGSTDNMKVRLMALASPFESSKQPNFHKGDVREALPALSEALSASMHYCVVCKTSSVNVCAPGYSAQRRSASTLFSGRFDHGGVLLHRPRQRGSIGSSLH